MKKARELYLLVRDVVGERQSIAKILYKFCYNRIGILALLAIRRIINLVLKPNSR